MKAASTPILSWRELERLAGGLSPELEGMHVDRIVVPHRAFYPGGFIKGEWGLRLHSRKKEQALIFSVRPRHPYIILDDGRGPKASPTGTRSVFDLALAKHLRGARVLSFEALSRERTLILWLTAEGQPPEEQRLGLVLTLIPAIPEALLIQAEAGPTPTNGYPVLARSRMTGGDRWIPPDGSRSPPDVSLRDELVAPPSAWLKAVTDGLRSEAYALRLRACERGLRDILKQAEARARQSETAIAEAGREPDWQRYGDLMKAHLADPGPVGPDGMREVLDYESGEQVKIPADLKLSPQAQVEKFFQMARRRARRISEASSRLEGFQETIERTRRQLDALPETEDWKELEKLERSSSGAVGAGSGAAEPGKGRKAEKGKTWLGKVFRSKEDWPILVGRSRDENLELTFKFARGNDLWMHVRGRPGAHCVVPVQPGKSVPLETLLDAAHLTLYYSGGEKWGKTEVDYTFKKYVKRIKDSTEASYVNNKTLIIEPDQVRLKRLLNSGQ